MLAPSPSSLLATGSQRIADHFPGNQERGGAALASGNRRIDKRRILSPYFPLHFLPRYKKKEFAKSRFWANSGRTEKVISLLWASIFQNMKLSS